MAVLARLVSTRSIMSSFDLGTIMSGDTQGVGPSAFSMISSDSNLFSFLDNVSRRLNGIRRNA